MADTLLLGAYLSNRITNDGIATSWTPCDSAARAGGRSRNIYGPHVERTHSVWRVELLRTKLHGHVGDGPMG